MVTLREVEGSIPSVLGESAGAVIVRPRITTFSQSVGTRWNEGEFINVTPFTVTPRQPLKRTRRGRFAGRPGRQSSDVFRMPVPPPFAHGRQWRPGR